MITKESLDREASRYSRRISNAPGQERAYVSIEMCIRDSYVPECF